MMRLFGLVFLVLSLWACNAKSEKENWYEISELLFEDSFNDGSLDNWISEIQEDSCSSVLVKDGKMDIDVCKGTSIWLDQYFEGGVLIEYDATVIGKGGPNDRVSDLNCFWNATDPRSPKDLFDSPRKASGMFHDYDTLQLYYVGMGGHNNTKTRFRRYTGDGNKPLLAGHDLSAPDVLIEANKTYRIQLIALNGRVQFIRDGAIIYDFKDEDAYEKGWFGIRTINNHMSVDNVKVYQIKGKDE
ncbi:DUF6250 domain-containing protein [Marinifilum flexuosum]|uniref:DUF6250 domain-containing protein n=1 Tax=Marinifilum flexuosum TaxID=1117708 RepID=UPI00249149D7|nr:DUF6250 domain-containing protein [Marinifilum flexuosum]